MSQGQQITSCDGLGSSRISKSSCSTRLVFFDSLPLAQILTRRVEEEHQETLETLEVLKLKLERATEERSNKIEYDLLAKKISKLPDRQTAQQ